MSIEIDVYIEAVDEAIEQGYRQVRLYRDTAPERISTSSTVAGIATLVAGQEHYRIEDTAGDATFWYAYTLYNSDTTQESPLSRRFRASETTLLTLLYDTARECAAAFKSACTAAGAATSLIDVRLEDAAVDEHFGSGWWVLRPHALPEDRVRRVAAGGYAAGALSVTRSWMTAPSPGEVYYAFNLAPPLPDEPGFAYSWADAVNAGLIECRWVDRLNLGDGDGRTTDFALDPFLGTISPDRDLRGVYGRNVTPDGRVLDLDWSKRGRWWERVPNNGAYTLRLHPAPPWGFSVWVEVRRHGEPLYTLDDTTDAPSRQAALAAAWQMLEHLASNHSGEYVAQARMKRERWERQRRLDSAPGVVLV